MTPTRRVALEAPEPSPIGTRPFFGWMAEVADEGCVVVNASDYADAMTQVRKILNADDVPDGEEPSEVVVRPVTAADVERLLPEG